MDEVLIRARCLLPEVLMQRAMDAGVCFIAVKPMERGLVLKLRAGDAKRFMKLCERYAIPAEVLSRRGGSALRLWLRRRWTVLIGLLAGLMACAWFLGHIWVIDIAFTGDAADLGDAAAVTALLRSMGVRPGISRRLDTAALSDALAAAAADYSYVGARVDGVRLFIEAAPEVPAPEVYDVKAPRNLFADRDGIVVSVNVEAGAACVKPGDAVRRGQLLIAGEEKVSKEQTRPIAALGQVTVRAWFEGSAEGYLKEVQARATGRQSASASLKTPWLELPLQEGERYGHQIEERDALVIGGLFVPLMIDRVMRREIEFVTGEGDRALLSARLEILAMADARARLAAEGPARYEITRCWVRMDQPDSDTLRASAVLEILTNAAAVQEPPQQGG